MKRGQIITNENINEITNKVYKPEVITFIEDAIEFGCEVYYDRGSISIYTKEGSIDKAHDDGHLLMALFNGESNSITEWHTWYEYNEHRQMAMKDYDNELSFKEVYDSCINELDKCPICGERVGLENIEIYGFAGRACKNCIKDARDSLPHNWWN